jgi:hypothetical protein
MLMETTFPDTLVLKIVEYDVDTKLYDTVMYVIYDKRHYQYIIRGSRRATILAEMLTYSFTCDLVEDLADFIEFVLDRHNNISYILYNYDNLPEFSNEITYQLLQDYDDLAYEIAGYDNQHFSRRSLVKNLKILRNVYNYY